MGSSIPESRLEAARADLKPQHVSLVAYAIRHLHRSPFIYRPVEYHYTSLAEELSDRLRMKGMGFVPVYRVTAKPKAACPA